MRDSLLVKSRYNYMDIMEENSVDIDKFLFEENIDLFRARIEKEKKASILEKYFKLIDESKDNFNKGELSRKKEIIKKRLWELWEDSLWD